MNRFGIVGLVGACAWAQVASAGGVQSVAEFELARLDFSQASGQGGDSGQAAAATTPTPQTSADFGTFNTTWWTFGAGTSTDFDELSDINVTIAWSKFVDEDVELMLELAVRDFDMPGDDQIGINPMLVFRKHWKLGEDHTWTAFADVGIGVMITADDVPQDGTSINFTPRLGGGLTYAINEDWRVVAGLRWSHISNGRIFGDDDNPASDGVMFGVGLTTSF